MRSISFISYIMIIFFCVELPACKTNLNLEKKDSAGSITDDSSSYSDSDLNSEDDRISSDSDSNSDSTSQDSSGCFSLSSEPVDDSICELETLIIKKTNEYRSKKGLKELSTNLALSYVARDASTRNHSTFIAHSGFPYQRTSKLRQCDSASGSDSSSVTNLTGENWANYPAGYDNESVASGIVNMWINSSGHRQNMLKNHTYIGVGISKSGSYYYSIQLFGN